MTGPRARAALIVGGLSIVVLGAVWAIVLLSLPSRQDIADIRPAQPAQPAPQPSSPQGPPASNPSAQTPHPPAPPISKPRPSAPRPPRLLRDQNMPVDQGMSPNCMAELEKLCPDDQSGSSRRKCFQDNEHTLSSTCRQQLDAMAVRIKEDVQQFKAACETDVKRLCRSVERGGGRILQCLEEKYQEVSDDCYHALRTRPFRK